MRLAICFASLLVLLSGCDALFGPPDYSATLSGDVEAVREGDGIMGIGIGVIGNSSNVRLGDGDPDEFYLVVTFPARDDIFPPADGTAVVGTPAGEVRAALIEPSLDRSFPDIQMEGSITTQCVGSRLTGSFSLSSMDTEVDLAADGTFDIPRYNADQYPCG